MHVCGCTDGFCMQDSKGLCRPVSGIQVRILQWDDPKRGGPAASGQVYLTTQALVTNNLFSLILQHCPKSFQQRASY